MLIPMLLNSYVYPKKEAQKDKEIHQLLFLEIFSQLLIKVACGLGKTGIVKQC